MDENPVDENGTIDPERPPEVKAGTVLVGCLVLLVFAVIALIVLSVVASA